MTVTRVSVADLEFDFEEIEEEETFKALKVEEKISCVLKLSEREICKWNREVKTEKRAQKNTYEVWKEKLTEKFCAPKVAISEYFCAYQRGEKGIEDFIKRMESDGKILKLSVTVRLLAIKGGIRRYRKHLLEEMTGVDRLSDGILRRLRAREALKKESTHTLGTGKRSKGKIISQTERVLQVIRKSSVLHARRRAI
ncbi:hypothetical protein PAEPH01_2557 [Pancytospora epiphaga]|nr:hypothetical protein PAEPH01_2557 [Pancytospora epiphaga]